jgi:hypothetical protein
MNALRCASAIVPPFDTTVSDSCAATRPARLTITTAPSAMPYRHPRQQAMTDPLLDYFKRLAQFRIGCQETVEIPNDADVLCSKLKD